MINSFIDFLMKKGIYMCDSSYYNYDQKNMTLLPALQLGSE